MWDHIAPISFPWTLALVVAAWFVFALVANRVHHANPREEPIAGIVWFGLRIYARLVHRIRVEGAEHLPARRGHGPLVLVANHTAGVDPLLIQSAVPFEIRFLMARDMQPSSLRWMWDWTGVIPVSRDGPDSRAAREAIRWLTSGGLDEAGGVIGIFPEGGIERPPQAILPFLPGIGLIVLKGRARVLPVVVQGTPYSQTAWGSLIRRSRSIVRFLPIIDYPRSTVSAAGIATDLRERFLRATGWPANDAPERALTRR